VLYVPDKGEGYTGKQQHNGTVSQRSGDFRQHRKSRKDENDESEEKNIGCAGSRRNQKCTNDSPGRRKSLGVAF
jgi:hypothetical protein